MDGRAALVLVCACGAPIVELEGSRSSGDGASSSSTTEASIDPESTGTELDIPDAVVAFTDVTAEAGLEHVQGFVRVPPLCLLDHPNHEGDGDWCTPERMTGGVAVGDYDGDGLPDLWLTRLDGGDVLLHNEGDGTFVDRTADAGVSGTAPTNGVAWVDVDRDGDLDAFVTTVSGTSDALWIQIAPGRFEDQARARGAAGLDAPPHVGETPAVGDYDGDGWPDLFVGEWRPLGPGGDVHHTRLLRNTGDGAFEDVTIAAGLGGLHDLEVGSRDGVFAFAPAFVDLDGDGWLDLAIAGDFGTSRLYWNDGAGGFVDGTEAAGVGLDRHGMGSTFGDIDLDGDLDWFVTAIWTANRPHLGNRLYLNEGGRRFRDATDAYGVRDASWAWGTAMADLDNDGVLDIVATAGWLPAAYADAGMKLWLGDALPREDSAARVGLDVADQGRGLAVLDYDVDGDLDLVVAHYGSTPRLYRNDSTPRAFLRVRVDADLEGTGAVVTVQARDGGPVQTRWIGASTHFLGQSERVAHFGLGDHEGPIARVHVRLPNGRERTWHNVEPDREVLLGL